MKMRLPVLSLFIATLVLVSCKKEKHSVTPPDNPPVNTDPELLGPETDKVAHYNFNGNLHDSSGNHLDAVNSSENVIYTADRFGRANHAAIFNENGNINWVFTPSLSSEVPGFPFSISLWFKADDVDNSQTLVRSDGGEANTYSGYWLQLGVAGAGTMSLSFGDNTGYNGSSRNTISTPAVFSANTWYHVVVNVRGADDMDFYINGVKNTNCAYSGSATTMVYHPTYTGGVIGLFPGASSTYVGLMDDYRIYTKALSQTEVSTLYNFQP